MRRLAAVLASGGVAVTVAAQVAPVAPLAAPVPATSPAPSPTRIPAAAAAELIVREWHLPQLDSVDEALLQRLTLPYLRRPFGEPQARALRDELARVLSEQGLALAGIALRVVDAQAGIVALRVVEPRLRRIELTAAAPQPSPDGGDPAATAAMPPEPPPLEDAQVQRLLEREGVRAGGLLDLRRLDAALFALNDLPGVQAKASLVPTGDAGRHDLVIERGWRRRHEGSVDADTHGSRYNGRQRLGLLWRWNEPAGRGDNLDLRLQAAPGGGLVSTRLSYEGPLGRVGDSAWRSTLAWSALRYELGDLYAPLQARGQARVWDLGLSRPLERSRERNVVLRLGASHKRLVDRFDAFALRTDKHSRDLNAALSFESRDGWGGGGYVGGALTLAIGQLRIDTPSARAEDAALGRRAAQGRYLKAGLQLNRLQALAPGWSLSTGLGAAWSDRNLDPSEKFALGGASAVRAYPPGEAAADRAAVLTLELRHALGQRWSVFGLHDRGWARLQARPQAGAAAGAENGRQLDATGLGLYFSDPAWLTLRGSLAWPGAGASLSEPGRDGPRLNLQLQRSL